MLILTFYWKRFRDIIEEVSFWKILNQRQGSPKIKANLKGQKGAFNSERKFI